MPFCESLSIAYNVAHPNNLQNTQTLLLDIQTQVSILDKKNQVPKVSLKKK
jgi:hypothetical protein